jgi:hypothetical protein
MSTKTSTPSLCRACGLPLPVDRDLGPFGLTVAGYPVLYDAQGNVIALRCVKWLGLLVRLAVESGRTFTRPFLADFLWPNADETRTNHSLAQALSVLKAFLGREAFLYRSGTVHLHQGIVEVVTEGEWPFCDGLEFRDAPSWDDWREAQRAAAKVQS